MVLSHSAKSSDVQSSSMRRSFKRMPLNAYLALSPGTGLLASTPLLTYPNNWFSWDHYSFVSWSLLLTYNSYRWNLMSILCSLEGLFPLQLYLQKALMRVSFLTSDMLTLDLLPLLYAFWSWTLTDFVLSSRPVLTLALLVDSKILPSSVLWSGCQYCEDSA